MKTSVTNGAISPPPPYFYLTKTILILTAAFILTFALASCKDDDGGGIGNTIRSEAPVNYPSGTSSAAKGQTNFSFLFDGINRDSDDNFIGINTKPLSYYINEPASVTIKDNNVSINLGIPKDLEIISSGSLTVTPSDTKGFEGFDEFCTSDGKYVLYCMKDSSNYAYLTYVDRDANIKGSGVDMNLKLGWNYLIMSRSGSTQTMTASTTLPSGFNWTVSDTDYSD
jgi:hypothetical protein